MIFTIEDLILNSNDYTFSPFAHKGLGGINKYIATPKSNNLPKLIIKHKGEFSPPCNGFIYGRIGQLMGATVPNVYLIDVSDKDKHLFLSECVIGIEYIDGLQPLDMEEIRVNSKLTKDFVNCFALSGLFTNFEDNMQCAYLPNKSVYPLDFDESFGLENALLSFILHPNSFTEFTVKRQLQNCCDKNLELYMRICNEESANALQVPIDSITPIMLDTIKRFCTLTEKEIVSVTDAIIELYPPLLAVYYEEYLKILQDKASDYIKTLEVL